MDKKIYAIGMAVVLVISVVALYSAISGPQKLETTLQEVIQRIGNEIQVLNNKSTPYIYTGNPVGYVIEFENGAKFYFAGDTALTYDMKFVAGDYYKADVAFLPIGDVYTMGADSAAFAASVINPEGLDYVVPIHYGETSCPMVNADINEFSAALNKYSVKAQPLIFEVGEEKEIMGVKVLFLGGSSWFFVSPTGVRFFIDPSMQFNLSLLDKHRDLAQFERVDLILLTHAHFDHMSVDDMQKWSKAYDPIIVAPYELGIWLSAYVESPILSINAGGTMSEREWGLTSFDPKRYERIKNITFHLVHALHSSVATPAGVSASAADQYILE